jgi:hypothetical protein
VNGLAGVKNVVMISGVGFPEMKMLQMVVSSGSSDVLMMDAYVAVVFTSKERVRLANQELRVDFVGGTNVGVEGEEVAVGDPEDSEELDVDMAVEVDDGIDDVSTTEEDTESELAWGVTKETRCALNLSTIVVRTDAFSATHSMSNSTFTSPDTCFSVTNTVLKSDDGSKCASESYA